MIAGALPAPVTSACGTFKTWQTTLTMSVFREDLKYNPGNGRSLFGVWQSLDAQGNKAEAARARREFERVWRVADVTLRIEDF